ncbi:MAG: response regulator transcription factor [Nitrospinaceae bacterium]|nr:response regulator transcription factor [Nitrospinaceae bacterium]MBT4429567.1 response regulator transcription factor [Nitrospinaceae bacterium]MBT5948811.1 response regulator transcription factor [Nitrospinaceae bacterium]MBT6393164.1 response regulator transcription factor [Nitrospinaceae bacterium]MBT7856371.1 response regulator transcription factor [Nitrospinaceae bacterium]
MMSKLKILLVDDESEILTSLEYFLSGEGYEVSTALSGEAALSASEVSPPNLAILDIRMPGIDGFELCRKLRKKIPSIRIIFLSTMQKDVDKAKGLMLGGDDYIGKPFSSIELLARVKTVLRDVEGAVKLQSYRFGAIEIHPISREVTKDGVQVDLTTLEFDLAHFFVRHPGEVFTRAQLLVHVWEQDSSAVTRTVDYHVYQLRKKFGDDPDDPKNFMTIRGVGYKFLPD